MNACLQAHGEKLVYPVPTGLHELMNDIAREVLKEQPSDIFRFIWNYLNSLYKLRELTKHANEFVNDLLDYSVNEAYYIEKLGISKVVANKAACIIQNAYRNFKGGKFLKKQLEEKQATDVTSISIFLMKKDLDFKTANDASKVIQRAYRNHRASKEVEIITLTASESSQLIPLPDTTPLFSKHHQSKLVYEQSPESSGSWNKPADLVQPNIEPYKLVMHRVTTTDVYSKKHKTKVSKTTKGNFFTSSGSIVTKSSGSTDLLAKETEQLEEKAKSLLYPPAPTVFNDVDFTKEITTDEDDLFYQSNFLDQSDTVQKNEPGHINNPVIGNDKPVSDDVPISRSSKTKTGLSGITEIPENDTKISNAFKDLLETVELTEEKTSHASKELLETVVLTEEKTSNASKELLETVALTEEKTSERKSQTSAEKLLERVSKSSSSGEARTSSKVSVSDILERLSKSSVPGESKKSPNISASDLLERVSKSSVKKASVTSDPKQTSEENEVEEGLTNTETETLEDATEESNDEN